MFHAVKLVERLAGLVDDMKILSAPSPSMPALKTGTASRYPPNAILHYLLSHMVFANWSLMVGTVFMSFFHNHLKNPCAIVHCFSSI